MELRYKIAIAFVVVYVPLALVFGQPKNVNAEDNPPEKCEVGCSSAMSLSQALHYCKPVRAHIEKLLDQVARIELTFCNDKFAREYDVSILGW